MLGKMRKKKTKSKLRENVEAVLLALLIALCFKGFIVDHYMVPTGSMVPTIDIGDHLFAVKFFYGAKVPMTKWRLPAIRSPRRGDVVVFESPFYEKPNVFVQVFNPVLYTLTLGFATLDKQPKFYVKRCMGVPGNVVQIIGKNVYVDGELVEGWWADYHSDPTIIPPGDDLINQRDYFGPVTVPEDSYFMMGDNRDESYDSRFWGFVERGDIYGKALVRVWPLRGMGLLK
jgi:signal peptidase I